MRRWVKYLGITCLALMVFSLMIIGVPVYRLFYKPMIPKTGMPMVFSVDKAMPAGVFVRRLKDAHLFKFPVLLRRFIQFQDVSTRLKAGMYQIYPSETVAHFLQRVVAGEVLVESFSIIAGTTQKQIAGALKCAPYLIYHEPDWFLIGADHASPEGLLLADTYYYAAGSGSNTLILRAHASLEQVLQKAWETRASALPYRSSYELLIAASIIEKESALPEERRLISGVIVNRLRKNMRLQMDPTVIYALGERYHGSLLHSDLNIDSPYNSYRYYGLPPTPIAMVGKDAIDAAAHPVLTDYLYFVARGDGHHDFSVNYEAQKRAISRLRKKHS